MTIDIVHKTSRWGKTIIIVYIIPLYCQNVNRFSANLWKLLKLAEVFACVGDAWKTKMQEKRDQAQKRGGVAEGKKKGAIRLLPNCSL